MDFVWLLIGLIFFNYKNPQRKLLWIVSFFVVGLSASQIIGEVPNADSFSKITWILCSIGLTVSYSLRFFSKGNFRTIDYFKIPALVMFVIYHWQFYSFADVYDSVIWSVTRSMTFCFITAVFIYDRIILQPETMKRKFIVVLVIQSVFILLTLMYAFVQQAEASKQRQKAEEQSALADELRMELEKSK